MLKADLLAMDRPLDKTVHVIGGCGEDRDLRTRVEPGVGQQWEVAVNRDDRVAKPERRRLADPLLDFARIPRTR